MTKWMEERIYEIMNHINNDPRLKDIYNKEIQKFTSEYPHVEFYDKMVKCYESAKQKIKYENL
jgi:hypothetical protein